MLRRFSTAFVGALLGLLCAWLLDATQEAPIPPLVRIAQPAPTRLVVLLVDSLADRDVTTPGAMPKLAARLRAGALHGSVQPCADAITVPCVAAAISGRDRLSVFALGANFSARGGAVETSVLGQLQRAGLRVGYFGERMLAKPMQGLTRVIADLENDAQLMQELSLALQQDDLQVLIAHFRALDQSAHEHGDSAPGYTDTRHRVDEQLEAVITQLRPSDHVVIMGDHGHTKSGRHAAGLETTSYAAYLGPQFVRTLATPMLITDHAAIWARVFGFTRATPSWLEDYYAGRPPQPRGDTETSAGVQLPLWALLLCTLLACAASIPASTVFGASGSPGDHAATRAPRVWLTFFSSMLVMVTLGVAWPALRAFSWQSKSLVMVVSTVCTAVMGGLGAQLLGWLEAPARSDGNTWHQRYARFLAAAIVFAIPTVYWQGGPSIAQAWLVVGLGGYAAWFAVEGRRKHAALTLVAAMVALSLLPVKHANYVMRGFPVYTKYLPRLSPHASSVAAAAFLLSALVAGGLLIKRRPTSWLAATLGVAAAASVGFIPDLWFVVPCTLALPLVLLALRHPAITPVSLAFVLPAIWFFYGEEPSVLAPIFGVWLLCALVPRLFRESDAALRGALLLTLLLISFRASMGCRIAGIDFEFFFRFLPEGTDVTIYWVRQSLLTVCKYLLPTAFGVLLARAGDSDLSTSLQVAALLGRARVGMCLFFLGALIVAHPEAGTTIIGDATQEAAFWVIALATLGILSLVCSPLTARERV